MYLQAQTVVIQATLSYMTAVTSAIIIAWLSTAHKVLVLQSSYAAAERVFSLLKASFNDQRERLAT